MMTRRRTRHLGALLLAGGWLLLFNPHERQPMLDLASWEEVDDYDTSYLCEQGRREEMRSFAERERQPLAQAELRYRCERVERVKRPTPPRTSQK